MSKAAESIVCGYVVLKNRRALEDLLAHRQRLIDELSRVCGIDPMQVVDQIRQEIAIIEAGLERLDHETTGAQQAGRVEVLQPTVSHSPPSIDQGASTVLPTAETARATDHFAPPARKFDAEFPAAHSASPREQSNTEIRVLGLEVSVASPGAAVAPLLVSSCVVSGPDPGAFALGAPSSSEPQIDEHGGETETPHSTIDVFKSLMSVWKDEK